MLKHLIEFAALVLVFCLFRLLPLDAASALGGRLGRTIGPFLKAHRTAKKNLALAFPDYSEERRAQIVRDMWDNLGRIAAEMPRIPHNGLMRRLTVHGLENLPAMNAPMLLVSGHLGNWELTYPILHQRGMPLAIIYRRANNPFVDRLIIYLRATHSKRQLPKGPAGAIGLVRAIKEGQSIALLIDQKMNDGIPVPFFGHEAMTAPAVAQFALRYGLPIVPAQIVRTGGAHFELTIHPPLAYDKTGDEEKDIYAIMVKLNAMLESWIRARPEQWFWVHKRWPQS